jgi:hypothetical protein
MIQKSIFSQINKITSLVNYLYYTQKAEEWNREQQNNTLICPPTDETDRAKCRGEL